MIELLRKLYGRRHPCWFVQRHGKRIDIVWADGPQVFVFFAPGRKILSPDKKGVLVIRSWTKFLLPGKAVFKTSQPLVTTIDTDSIPDATGYSLDIPEFV